MSIPAKTGRKLKYGEPTTLMRVPNSMVQTVETIVRNREILETQYQKSLLSPSATRLLELITERMLLPQRAMIKSFREGGFPKLADELEAQLSEDKRYYMESNVRDVFTALQIESIEEKQEAIRQTI